MARAGVEAGCTEALFTLGDKLELLYDQAKHEVGHLCKPDFSSNLELLFTGALPP